MYDDDEDPQAAARRREEEAAYAAAQALKRKQEAEALAARQAAEARAEQQRLAEERRAKAEEIARKKREEEMYKRMGTDVIQPLPEIPPSLVDDMDPRGLKAWYLDEETSKPQLRCLSLKPGKKAGDARVTLHQLRDIGVVYFRINISDFSIVNRIVKHRCYKHTDELKLHQTHKDEATLDKWFVEHFNEDEQVRLITDGSCYIDVRSKQDTWIRMCLQAGDMVAIPGGMYQRGTLDENDFCAMMRLFQDSGRFNPIYRSERRAETLASRKDYIQALRRGNVASEMGWK
eukprot:PhM_4_TR11313/c0_g1_i1/m.99424/K08967/mtnD, mtnZ, ADI1; 1,2-dihydroxy-3-keto-5-methylthiopentene dioxygenase